jgi:signal transduction histidine kinase
MRERVEILGGTFSVESAPGRGTVIRASLPVAPLEAEHD